MPLFVHRRGAGPWRGLVHEPPSLFINPTFGPRHRAPEVCSVGTNAQQPKLIADRLEHGSPNPQGTSVESAWPTQVAPPSEELVGRSASADCPWSKMSWSRDCRQTPQEVPATGFRNCTARFPAPRHGRPGLTRHRRKRRSKGEAPFPPRRKAYRRSRRSLHDDGLQVRRGRLHGPGAAIHRTCHERPIGVGAERPQGFNTGVGGDDEAVDGRQCGVWCHDAPPDAVGRHGQLGPGVG